MERPSRITLTIAPPIGIAVAGASLLAAAIAGAPHPALRALVVFVVAFPLLWVALATALSYTAARALRTVRVDVPSRTRAMGSFRLAHTLAQRRARISGDRRLDERVVLDRRRRARLRSLDRDPDPRGRSRRDVALGRLRETARDAARRTVPRRGRISGQRAPRDRGLRPDLRRHGASRRVPPAAVRRRAARRPARCAEDDSSPLPAAIEEYVGAREYRHGDAPKLIHRVLSLRARDPDQFYVREFQDPSRDDLSVVLDTSPPLEGDDALHRYRLEKAICFVAALCRTFAARRLTVRFVCQRGARDVLTLRLRPLDVDLDRLERRAHAARPQRRPRHAGARGSRRGAAPRRGRDLRQPATARRGGAAASSHGDAHAGPHSALHARSRRPMRDWLRRVDPAFFHKEPHLLRAQAQIDRYTEESQADVRLSVLTADPVLHAATTIVAFAAYLAATGAGALGARGDWPTVWAFAVLAVAWPRALPWWPRRDAGATWRQALIGSALVAIPAVWTRLDLTVLGIAVLVAATLYVARERGRIMVLVLAAGVLFGAHVPAHPLVVAPCSPASSPPARPCSPLRTIAPVWRRRPQIVTWSALAIVPATCAFTFAFAAPAVAPRVPAEIAAIAVAYLGVCVMAGRIRRAELIALPDGMLTIPQSIVPLLDRSHHHAIICWRD